VLADAALIARKVRPGTHILRTASRRLDAAVRTGTPVLRRTVGLADDLGATLRALDDLASDPLTNESLRLLRATVSSLEGTLRVLGPAQIVCNTAGIWTRNVPSTISEGDAAGSWFRTGLVLGSPQILQSATADPQLHVNYYPTENASRCEAGNETYKPGQSIGNPSANPGTTVDITAPPPGVLEAAYRAGLLSPTPGLRP
jgi:hypothetical protein